MVFRERRLLNLKRSTMVVVRLSEFRATRSFRECVVCIAMKDKIVETYYATEDFRIYLCGDCHEPYYAYCDVAGMDYRNQQILHEEDCQLCCARWTELYKKTHHWARMCTICLDTYKKLPFEYRK